MLDRYLHTCLPIIESQLQSAINQIDGSHLAEMKNMLAYHMGWEGSVAGADSRGKRIRPMLVLLTTIASGGNWKDALPAACAVELIHNFSLIHDDIEDNSPQRRGRPTVWKKWGIAQATNIGDTMFTLAHMQLLRLADILPPENVIRAATLLHQVCLQLTQGQYLDLAYEHRDQLAEDDYWCMISGKTATLLAACAELGAMTAAASEELCKTYHEFGYALGSAFQAQDDYLGIWGDAELTGKSNDSDLVSGKKTLPIIYGLNSKGEFYQRWIRGSISPTEAPILANLLEQEGAKSYIKKHIDRLTNQAIQHLEAARPYGDAGDALKELTNLLLHRKS